MASNLHSQMEIDEVKAIAMRPVEGGYEIRLLENGRSLSGVVPLTREDLNHIGQYGYKLSRGGIQIALEMGIYRLAWQGKEWAAIRAGFWWEMPTMCDAIRKGAQTSKPEVWERARVRMVGVRAAHPRQS